MLDSQNAATVAALAQLISRPAQPSSSPRSRRARRRTGGYAGDVITAVDGVAGDTDQLGEIAGKPGAT